MQDLNELKKITYDIGKRRMENGADLSKGDFLKHCGKELVSAVMAREEFLYLDFLDSKKIAEIKNRYASELADIIICVLNEAEKADIDIEFALEETIRKNEARANLQGDKI